MFRSFWVELILKLEENVEMFFYLGAGFVPVLASRGQRSDGKTIRVLPVSDLGLLHQAVQLFLGHVLHLLPVG